MVTMESLQETNIALSSGTIDDLYDLTFRQNAGLKYTTRDMSNFEWPYLRNGLSDPVHVSFQDRVFRVGG